MPSFPVLPQAKGDAPRCVANLAFPEILVIWALRRFTAGRQPRGARLAAIAPEFSRALGLARLEEALAAFGEVAETLASAARLPQALSMIEDDRINATEEALLAALAAFQRGAAAQAQAICEWCLLPPGRRNFVAAAGTLAETLRDAGQLLPYTAPQRHSLTLENDPETAQTLPSAGDLAALRRARNAGVPTLH